MTRARVENTFAGNQGGAFYAELANLYLTDALVWNTSAAWWGGGVSVQQDSVSVVRRTHFCANSAMSNGAAVDVGWSQSHVEAIVIQDPTSPNTGKAIALGRNPSLTHVAVLGSAGIADMVEGQAVGTPPSPFTNSVFVTSNPSAAAAAVFTVPNPESLAVSNGFVESGWSWGVTGDDLISGTSGVVIGADCTFVLPDHTAWVDAGTGLDADSSPADLGPFGGAEGPAFRAGLQDVDG
ncbi:MAG: hypothetical protein KC656_01205, partial [Myxococcales bacterium]|nr:hypothetical protein [Myxococcales bacterium]